jgi:hypothetical protein
MAGDFPTADRNRVIDEAANALLMQRKLIELAVVKTGSPDAYEADTGLPIEVLCKKHGFSEASCYAWKAKFGGMKVSDAQRLKTLGCCFAVGARSTTPLALVKPFPGVHH